MRRTATVIFASAALATLVSLAHAQGTVTEYYIGSFQGEVLIKDGQTPGRPGYYYYPEATQYPNAAWQYEHPVRCPACGAWNELGDPCWRCARPADQFDRAQSRQGAVYSPYALPGQYWYQKPRPTVRPQVHLGWPYVYNPVY